MVTLTRMLDVRVGGAQDRNALVLGSYEPSDDTTGVPADRVPFLTTLAGNQVITTPGTTLLERDITGWIDVRTSDVTIRRCRIWGDIAKTTSHGLVNATNAAVTNLLVEDCTIITDATTANFQQTGILGHDFVARRNRILNVIDGLGVFNSASPGTNSNVIIEGNYVGPLSWWDTPPDTNQTDGSHNDVIQIQGGVGTIVRYNKLWGHQATDVGEGINGGRFGATQFQSKSIIQFNDNVGDPYFVEIYENWCYAGEEGINGADSTMDGGGNLIATIHRNRFTQDQWFTPNHEVHLNTLGTWDAGVGTGNQNIKMVPGTPITVLFA